ncbi:Utp20p [Nakaseomyces bracarensis]|uniref:Utp20p n=1 Tax=Nakaseomyces bracarensis TaxID=273131 RepID=UPI003871EAFD
MKKNNTKTKTTKRYRYSSFKNRIDELRIEPARNLERAVTDFEVETSHLGASFDHWKDINLSSKFTELSGQLNPLVQTLPQILYHDTKIFDLLVQCIEYHDEYSLQPLLDMLAQFCHDLGPDFMKFYTRCITVLIDLVSDATKFESSNVFEWAFNALAYIFKYLSRVLTADLKVTSELLFPLLSHQKEYLSRFSAEALSFLIRKTSSKNLGPLIDYFFERLIQNNEDVNNYYYYDGLLTLFSESLVSTRDSLHSKANIIIGIMLDRVLVFNDETCAALFCDVWMNVSKHGSYESLEGTYNFIFEKLQTSIKNGNLNIVVQIMGTLVFSESGKKIPSWESVVSLIKTVIELTPREHDVKPTNIAFLISVLFRNADVKTMTQLHKSLFEFYANNFTDHYLTFYRYTLDICADKIISYSGEKYLNKFLEENWESTGEKIALFLLDLEKSKHLQNRLNIRIPSSFIKSISDFFATIKSDTIEGDEELYELYWRSIVLKYSNGSDNEIIFQTLSKLFKDTDNVSDFRKDLVGNLCLSVTHIDENDTLKLMKMLLKNISTYKDSVFFVNGFSKILKLSEKKSVAIKKEAQLILADYLDILSQNLILPDSNIRHETLELFSILYIITEGDCPQLVNECKIIEEIPLSLENGRPLASRIRAMSDLFLKLERKDAQIKIVFKHMFGLLTIRFSPIWDGVYEFISKTNGKCPDLAWDLLLFFMNVLEQQPVLSYPDNRMDVDSEYSLWNSRVDRLENTFNTFQDNWNNYWDAHNSVLNISQGLRGSFEYPGQIRNQTLKTQLLIPHLAEQHFRDIIQFFFNQNEFEELFEENFEETKNARNWTEADRNLLLKLLSKFKNIKNVYKADELHDRLLTLLGSKSTDVQKLALDAIFAYKESTVVKYRDNLKNLLDDTLFKDEMTTFFANNNEKQIEENHEYFLMPYVLRILFGRAQTPVTSSLKKSRKYAVISILPNLRKEYMIEFLRLGFGSFEYEKFFKNGYLIDESAISQVTLKRMSGFVNIVSSVLSILGSKYPEVLKSVLRPLIFVINSSYYVLGHEEIYKESAHMIKTASNLRQISLKCMNEFFETLGETLDWNEFVEDIHTCVVKPRLVNFAGENAQQMSSLLKIMVQWAGNEALYKFLYFDNFSSTDSLMKLLDNVHTKDPVLVAVLTACNDIITRPVADEEYIELVTRISASTLKSLPTLYQRLDNSESISTAIEVLVNLTENGYVQDEETVSYLLSSLTLILQDTGKSVSSNLLVKILEVVKTLIPISALRWEEIENLYKTVSRFYQFYSEKDIRLKLNEVLKSFSLRFDELKKVADVMVGLNSYSERRMQEYNFPSMLSTFKQFTEELYADFNEVEWIPIIHTSLFFMNDKDELAIRTNATHTLTKFVDVINMKSSEASAKNAIQILKDIIIPQVKIGLRKYQDEILAEYIALLEYIVQKSEYYKDLSDMRVLSHGEDEEASFFKNITHIQLHRRQRAIRRLKEVASQLSDNSIAHYLIPLAEQYVFSDEEKYRNIGNESLITIGELSNFMSWNQYKALVRRYMNLLKSKETMLKESVLLLTQVSSALMNTLICKRTGSEEEHSKVLRKMPNKLTEADSFIREELYPKLMKILSTRNDDTIVARMPLSECIVTLLLGLDEENKLSLLPGVLTSICQVLRSKSEELRDSVRNSLSKITIKLGSKYLIFIIKELVSALKKGSQVHVLSYTVHYVLRVISDELKHGDLDESAQLIVRVIMEDIFGSVGEEKESDNYRTKMKEVKVNRSYDTAEVLSGNISLSEFSSILKPIKSLLMERIGLKNLNKLHELLRHYSLGINHNTEASDVTALTLCFEIFNQGQQDSLKPKPVKSRTETEEHFLVELNKKKERVVVEFSLLKHTLQKFSLDLLRTIIGRNKKLMEPENLVGFIPLMKESLTSEDEAVLISTLKVLIMIVKLEFPENEEMLFKNCVRKALNIVKDSPSTTSELCQMCVKYLSAFIKYKDMKLKDTALSYVLERILPDLNEPNKQGLAFNFLKSLTSKHIVLPELYDIMDNVREIMVTNHSRDIRNVARSVYYHFLMEYDQSKGRLEKQFKFMVDNLQYPAPDGKQSVMELINLIVTKANPDLLSKLASSFFISLSNVAVNDDTPRCREMATLILTALLQRLDDDSMATIEKYITAWLKRLEEPQFLNLGLRSYKIYLEGLGSDKSDILNEYAFKAISRSLRSVGSESTTPWDLLYTSLSVFQTFVSKSESVYEDNYKNIWRSVIECLLYPHMWVRQAATTLTSEYIEHLDKFTYKIEDSEIQNIASRLLHQMRAPAIPEALASVATATIIKIAIYWNNNSTKFIHSDKVDTEELSHRYDTAIDYLVRSVASIIRSEENRNDTFVSKKFAIQIFSLLIQLLDVGKLELLSESILLPLFVYLEKNDISRLSEEEAELCTIAQECMKLLEDKVPVSAFSRAYANVKQTIQRRRLERRNKRSVLAVTAPDLAAAKKLKKHARSRQKRKHEKDENGFYQRKNKKRRV